MKKKLSWPLIAVVIHALLCALLSLPLPFLGGIYLGFAASFFLLWGITLPALSGGIGLLAFALKLKTQFSLWDMVVAVLSCLILLGYIGSAVGIWRNVTLNFVYLAIIAFTVFLWVVALVRCLSNRKKEKK